MRDYTETERTIETVSRTHHGKTERVPSVRFRRRDVRQERSETKRHVERNQLTGERQGEERDASPDWIRNVRKMGC